MSFHDVDVHEWDERQAQPLREGRFAEADIQEIAEGLEDMSRSIKGELASRLVQLILHLLKYTCHAGKRSRIGVNSIDHQRTEIDVLLSTHPSLSTAVQQLVAEMYPRAVRLARKETELPETSFPAERPWTAEQILNWDFLPE